MAILLLFIVCDSDKCQVLGFRRFKGSESGNKETFSQLPQVVFSHADNLCFILSGFLEINL